MSWGGCTVGLVGDSGCTCAIGNGDGEEIVKVVFVDFAGYAIEGVRRFVDFDLTNLFS